MLRWKRKRMSLFANEPDEFDDFMSSDNGDDGGSGDSVNPDDSQNKYIDKNVDEDLEEDEDLDDDSDSDDDADNNDDDFDSSDEEDEEDEDEDDDIDDNKDSTVTLLRKQNEELLKIVETLTKKKDEPEEEKPEPVINPLESEAFEKLAETLNWDDDETKAFKAFFELYSNHNINSSVNKATKVTPNLVNETITQQQKVTQIRDNFYSKHPMLTNIKNYVYQVSTQIARENPNMTIQGVLDKAAEISYEAMGIDKKAIKRNMKGDKTERGKKPAFPKSKGARKKAPKKSALERDFEAMLALDE